MLWIFVAVFVISTSINSCVSAENLTAVVWGSDVVSLDDLQKAFESSEIKAMEVGVYYGPYKAPPKPDTTTTTTTTNKPGESTTTTTTTTTTSTTPKPKPKPDPEHREGNWGGIMPQDPKVPGEESPAQSEKFEEDPEFNFYEVVAEDLWTDDATELKAKYEVVINENLKFSDFLEKAIEFSKGHEAKSIKFNFNDIESVEYAVDLIQKKHREIKFSIWLHADVLAGPNGNSPKFNAQDFIEQYKLTSKYVLSLGWVTSKVDEPKDGYTAEHTKAMKAVVTDIIEKNKIEEPLNVPLRALYVPKSTTVLHNFFKEVKAIHPKLTYSIWSAKGDNFNAEEVQKFVNLIGIDNVYLSLLPEDRRKINLGVSNGASGLIQFGLLNLATLAVLTIFRNGLN